MATLRDIRRRIASFQNTRKITKAMEMVAAAKLRKNQQRIEALRPYAADMVEMMVDLATYAPETRQYALMQERDPVRRVAVVAMVLLCSTVTVDVVPHHRRPPLYRLTRAEWG